MKCTRGQLEEFFESSHIWSDICEHLDKWIDDNHLMLEDPDGTMKIEDFKYHAAICSVIRRVKDIGSYILIDEDLRKEEK